VTGTLTAANLTIMAAGQGINEAGSTAADDATIKRAAQLAAEAAQPSEDLRGSVEYKRPAKRGEGEGFSSPHFRRDSVGARWHNAGLPGSKRTQWE